MRAPIILVFDSGLGGLSVQAEIVRLRRRARYVFLADDAVFPYGALTPDALLTRVGGLIGEWIGKLAPDIVVIACNTASTLALPRLRAAHPAIPFVGTVPAVKPAAAASQSRLISVLATPATVARDYTHDLIREHAAHCDVTLVGSSELASLAERAMRGESVPDEAIAREIAPCFVEKDGRRTDHVVLACTHYPLLIDRLKRLAPWPVAWVDPAPAIARRVDHVLETSGFANGQEGALTEIGTAIFTSGEPPGEALRDQLAALDLAAQPADERVSPSPAKGVLINIDVPDLEKAVAFYSNAFGLEPARRLGPDIMEMTGWATPVYLLRKDAGTPGAASEPRRYERHWTPVHLDVVVERLEEALARAIAAGGKAATDIRVENWGKTVTLADPFGHGFCLIEFLGAGYDEIAEANEISGP
jgi:glutamate racemase